MKRFRMRILFQNIPNYVILFIGILFANLILLFGFMFGPLLDHFEQEITTHLLAEHQYVLVSEEKTENKEAESYDVTVLKTQEGRYKSEEVMVYGVQENSAQFGTCPFMRMAAIYEVNQRIRMKAGLRERRSCGAIRGKHQN